MKQSIYLFNRVSFLATILVIGMFVQMISYDIPVMAQTNIQGASVEAGKLHSLLLKPDGTVVSWGRNNNGQLGVGSTYDYDKPVSISSLNNIIQIAAGNEHSIALKSDGSVWTWGDNVYGQLGLGDNSDKTAPVNVNLGGKKAVRIAAGAYHTLVLMEDGTIKSFGYNRDGGLGNGDLTNHNVPQDVQGINNAIDISAGYFHSVALTNDGTVLAWGGNDYYQLGNGSQTESSTYVAVDLSNVSGKVTNIDSTYHCNILSTDDNKLYSWGYNSNGEAGVGNNSHVNIPTKLTLEGNIEQLSGFGYSMSAVVDGQLWSWGYDNWRQVCDGVNGSKNTPQRTIINDEIVDISMGLFHCLAINSNGEVLAWGRNDFGLLGNSSLYIETPTKISNISNVQDVSAGYNFVLATTSDKKLYSWGYNANGRLGKSYSDTVYTPTHVPLTYNVETVDAGYCHGLLQDSTGKVYGFGYNAQGQLGLGHNTDVMDPTPLLDADNVTSYSAGGYHTIISDSNGVRTTGYNNKGQLGIGSQTNSNTFQTIDNNGASIVSLGQYYSNYVVGSSLYGFGENGVGQLGIESDTVMKKSPVFTHELNVKKVITSNLHSLLLDVNGEVYTYGYNNEGQLGNGSFSGVEGIQMIDESYMPEIIDIDSLNNTSYAVDINGDLWSWGANSKYEIGDGTTIGKNVPSKVDLPVSVKNITAGYQFAIALAENGDLYAWGYNLHGALGITERTINEPLIVLDLHEEIVNYYLSNSVKSNSAEIRVINGEFANQIDYELFEDATKISEEKGSNSTSIEFSGLTPNTLYTAKVKVYDNTGRSHFYESTICTKADVPDISLDATATAIEIAVSDGNPLETNYQIICGDKYVNSIGELSNYPTSVVLQNKSFNITDFEANQNYGIKVRAINKYGEESEWSIPKYAEYSQDLPEGPTDFKGSVESRTISLSWKTNMTNEEPYAVGYELEVDGEIIDMKYSREYSHEDLRPNTNHSYRVRSYNKAGYGEWSELLILTTLISNPSEATDIDIYEENNCVTISWKYDPNVFEYSIYFEELDGDSVEATRVRDFTIDGISSNYYKMYGLKPETTYRIRIDSINSLGLTQGANARRFTTKLLETPEVTVLECDNTEIVYTWEPIEGADSYVYGLYEIGANGVLSEVSIDKTESTKLFFTTDSNLSDTNDVDYETITIKNNTSYQFVVQAYASNGVSQYSHSKISKTPAIKPRNIAYVFGVAQDREVELYWEGLKYDVADQDYVDVTSYDVLINAELDEYGNIVSGILIENGIEDGDYQTYLQDHMMPFTTYNYRVRACSSNSVGDWSEPIEVTTLPGLPVVPTGIKVDTIGNVTTITWDDMPGSTSYEIMDCNKDDSVVYTLTDNIFTIGDVQLGVSKIYQLRAINDLGVGEWSGFIVNNSMRLQSSYGEEVDLNLTGSQILDFEPYILNVYYNSDVLTVRDLCGKTPIFETEAGIINLEDGSIELTQVSDGHITFTVYKEIELGYSWEGIINNIIFEGNISGGTTLDYTVFIDPALKLKNVGPTEEVEANQIAEPTPVVSQESPIYSGMCGDSANWTLTDGHLVISGTGATVNYYNSSPAPWSEYKESITKVTVETGITELGSRAFKDCTSLTEVSLPNTLTSIGNSALNNCSTLNSITIPNSVTQINAYAFYNSGLTEVLYNGTISEWVLITIEDNNDDLEHTIFSGTCGANVNWTLSNGHLEIVGTGSTTAFSSGNPAPWYDLRASITSASVSEGITTLGSQLFRSCNNLTNVSLPTSLTSIGSNAFISCISLATIAIPNGITDIGSFAFHSTGLTSANYLGTQAQWNLVTVGSNNEVLLNCITGEDF